MKPEITSEKTKSRSPRLSKLKERLLRVRNWLAAGLVKGAPLEERLLAGLTKRQQAEFVINDQVVGFADIKQVMPIIAWHARNLFHMCHGAHDGITFTSDADTKSLTGYAANLNGAMTSTSVRLCFLAEAYYDIAEFVPRSEKYRGAIEMDGIVRAFLDDMKILAVPAAAPATMQKTGAP